MPPREPVDRELLALEGDIIETLIAGLKVSRSDLSYPESHSDMTWSVQALLEMFDVKRRSIPRRIKWTHEEPQWCSSCRALTFNKYGECSGCDTRRYDRSVYVEMPPGECSVCPPGETLVEEAANVLRCSLCGSSYEPTGKGPVLKHRNNNERDC